MEIKETFKPGGRGEWRGWLERNHRSAGEIWVVLDSGTKTPALAYLDAVEEALCFGWIDGIAKKYSMTERAQRFTPRRKGGNWTELNKARARRLIRLGLMTEAGRAVLPDLAAPFAVPGEVLEALRARKGAEENFRAFPDLYRRIRVGYIAEARRDAAEFERRLNNFVEQTAEGRMFGNWTDGGRLGESNGDA